MKIHQIESREGKLNLLFNGHLYHNLGKNWYEEFPKLSPEKRKEYFEMRERLDQILRDTGKKLKELKNKNAIRNYEKFQVYDLLLEMEEISEEEKQFNNQGISRLDLNPLRILNLKDKPTLAEFRIGLQDFYLMENSLFRCVNSGRLNYVIENGFDKPGDTGSFAPYFHKAQNYGRAPPKLVLMYDPYRLVHLEGEAENYKYQFRVDPKESLFAVLNLIPKITKK